jgi:ATP-dependent RNA helicase DeaD
MAKHYQNNALRIAATDTREAHADIEYRAVSISARDVEHAVVNLLRYYEPPGALVFCNTRDAVRHLQSVLVERGFSVVALSGEMSQNERNQALQALRDGRARICVATDVAARGIDLPTLTLVIHADLPSDAEVLQHRSGRTGRAGKKGISVLLIPPQKRRRADMLIARARLNPVWATAPSAYAIKQLDQERLLENPVLTEEVSEDDAALAKILLDTATPEKIAAALVRMHRANLPAPEELADPGESAPKRERRDRGTDGEKDFGRPRKTRDTRIREARDTRDRGDDKPRRARTGKPGGEPAGDTVWFRLNVGRERNADPKWLLPEICNQGGITKQDIGQIRIFDRDTRFDVKADLADAFAERVIAQTKKGGVRISPWRGEDPLAGDGPTEFKGRAPRKTDWTPRQPVADEASLDDWASAKPRKPRREGIANWKPRYDANPPEGAAKTGSKAGGKPGGKGAGKPAGKGAPNAAKKPARKSIDKSGGPAPKGKSGKPKQNRAARRAKAL